MGTCGMLSAALQRHYANTCGLQYKGQEGVELALKILLEEFRTTMALAG